MFIVKDRDEAISNYEHYFDVMYNSNIAFKRAIDNLYELYKTGKPVYLECYCHPQKCHGDVIAEKLQQRLIKEKLKKK